MIKNNEKIRIIIIIVSVILIVSTAFAIWHTFSSKRFESSVSLGETPPIHSVPGDGHPSIQYEESQNYENALQAQIARKTSTSNVPTIANQSFVGSPEDFSSMNEDAKPKACSIQKTVYLYKPNPANCSFNNLRRAHEAGVKAEELVCQDCPCSALKMAGYNAGEIKNIGFSALQLKQCGYSLQNLINAGFSLDNLKQAGFSNNELKTAGYDDENLNEVKIRSCSKAEGDAAFLKAKGCSVTELKAQGFDAAQLKAAGFTGAELSQAGFNLKDLKNAGYSAETLRNAEKIAALCAVSELKNERKKGVSATALKEKGCDLSSLKEAGFSASELHNAGFSAKQLANAGYNARALAQAGFSAKELQKAGFSAAELKDAGFSAAQLKSAGFLPDQLKAAGFSANALQTAGFSANDLRKAGFSAADLKKAGFDTLALKAAGFSAGELKAAGVNAAALKAAGFNAYQLHQAGFSAASLKKALFTPSELTAAQYTRGDLLRAGFSPDTAGLSTAHALNQDHEFDEVNSRPRVYPVIPSLSASDHSPSAEIRAMQNSMQKQMSAQRREDVIQQVQGQMLLQEQKLMATWSHPAPQSFHEGDKKSHARSVGKQSKNLNLGPILKAGTVMFATLDTGINSDEKSPILATIVSGALKGAKLIGHFERVDQRVLVSFNLLNVPSFPKSTPINAVAIDSDTARTALAGDVNNHYLLRYGTLFASAFLSGISKAIITSGSSATVTPLGILWSHDTLNTSQQIAVGLGTAGEHLGSVLAPIVDTPPTVKVASGTGVGILIMADLSLPFPIN